MGQKTDSIRSSAVFIVVRQNAEIVQLHSQLDKYRTVTAVTFSRAEAASAVEPRKQRAHGISAEPHALTTVDDILSSSVPFKGKSKRKEADTVKALVAQIASYRHPKSPA